MRDKIKISVPTRGSVPENMYFFSAYFMFNQSDGNNGQKRIVDDHVADCLWSVCFAGNFNMNILSLQGTCKEIPGAAAWFSENKILIVEVFETDFMLRGKWV